MSKAAMDLFEKALSPDEVYQYEFAVNIETILSAFPQKFIIEEFYPFLATWIPRNNEKIVGAIAEKIDKLASVKDSCASLAAVLESLLASENKQIAKIIRNKLRASTISGDIPGMFQRILASPLDCVRAFAPQIINLLKNDEEKRQVFSALTYDSAFKVRFAACAVLGSVSDTLCAEASVTLAKDDSGRIRALLPIICSHKSFWLVEVAALLVKDHDWSVRASVARELTKCTDKAAALTIACALTEDAVWQVALCAVTALTEILKKADGRFDNLAPAMETLQKLTRLPQTSLKNAAIDAFLALSTRCTLDAERSRAFVDDVITRQPPHTRLHFLEAVATQRLQAAIDPIMGQLHGAVSGLLASDQWRVRLGVVRILTGLSELCGDSALKAQFGGLCEAALEDEATPVRVAAAEELAEFFVRGGKSDAPFPACFDALKASDSFRKRQSALRLLSEIARHDEKRRPIVVKEMRSFEADSCDNVVFLAKRFIAEYE